MVQSSSLSGARAVPLRVVLCSAGGGEDCSPGSSASVPLGRCLRTWTVAGAVPAARVSRFAGLGGGRAAFGGFGELPGGRPSVSGESLEAPGVQFMSVSKRFGSLCSGARGSEVGGEQCKQST